LTHINMALNIMCHFAKGCASTLGGVGNRRTILFSYWVLPAFLNLPIYHPKLNLPQMCIDRAATADSQHCYVDMQSAGVVDINTPSPDQVSCVAATSYTVVVVACQKITNLNIQIVATCTSRPPQPTNTFAASHQTCYNVTRVCLSPVHDTRSFTDRFWLLNQTHGLASAIHLRQQPQRRLRP
jgi:hypothetical protein